MNEAARLIDELTRVMQGDAWFGDSLETILDDVTPAMAAKRPASAVHSIWEIVRHLTAWTGEVHRRLEGEPAGEPREGDWPAPSGTTGAAWRADVAAYMHAHSRLLQRLERESDESLFAPTNDPRDRSAGTGVAKDVMLHGLAQHHAYHGGQIALLKKLLA